MAHYAFLDENFVVTETIVGKEEGNFDWEQFYGNMRGQLCKRYSINTRGGVHYNPETNQPSEDQSKSFRKNAACIGGVYDPQRDAFISPKFWQSWMLNETTCEWEPPVPYPIADEFPHRTYLWNEELVSWVKAEDEQ